MNEMVYARSPSPGEIEIVFAKNHGCSFHKLSEVEIATLWEALSEAIRHNYVAGLSPPRRTGSKGLEADREAAGDASRAIRDSDRERGMTFVPGLGYFKDKSHRKYGRA